MMSHRVWLILNYICISFLLCSSYQPILYANGIPKEEIAKLDIPISKDYDSYSKRIENKLVLAILIQTIEENLAFEDFERALNEYPFSALDLDKDNNVDFISVLNYRIKDEFKIALFSSSSLDKDLLVARLVFNLQSRCFRIEALKEIFIDNIYADRYGCIEESDGAALGLSEVKSREECYREYNQKVQAANDAGKLTSDLKRKFERELRACRGTSYNSRTRFYGRGLFWTSLQDRPYHQRHTYKNPPTWYQPKSNKPLNITSNSKRGTSGSGKL